MARTEKELDQALAAALERDPSLVAWLLSHTKFSEMDLHFHGCRSNHPWGSHPFVAPNAENGEPE